ncbi:MAG: 23S rRNA (guanosine(2251)-2'-O)-methyltransferase RlmB [Saprospiraceae bacterium]|nr:23S rRNA (guanosine(2251)-2'-O)-methyltransferase RlmB [Saprospiraceae bacterium]
MQFDKSKDQPAQGLVILGKNSVLEAIREGKEIEKIFIQNNLRGEFEKEIRSLSRDLNIPLVKVPLEKLNQLTQSNRHQGVIAYVSPVKFQSLADLVPHLFDHAKSPCLLVLEGVSDVRNLAAIARSAHVMGVDALVITSKNIARINEETVRISAGAILNIPVCRERNMFEVIDILKNNGIRIFATDLKGSTAIDQVDFTGPLAIVMGDEHHGVTLETLRAADEKIKIPQATDFDSLNVSVATGMVLYEITRQRQGLYSK